MNTTGPAELQAGFAVDLAALERFIQQNLQSVTGRVLEDWGDQMRPWADAIELAANRLAITVTLAQMDPENKMQLLGEIGEAIEDSGEAELQEMLVRLVGEPEA